ncbi:MAG: polyprenyl synthetase family protein [Candidatus Eisenbacteria bacterium]|uniref:Polyprenyl synthetase family protein n=1 Tax=Eiseniibacteriota bacterium TaxID=2212470 RepID=A0A849SJF1_UNCEI|nr:polyprenyl synthetase family protein [Candidatus Eisenbacteria bacterium]
MRPRPASKSVTKAPPDSDAIGTLATGPLANRLAAFEAHLDQTLTANAKAPTTLSEAIRYAALSPGKRLRPLFVLTTCEAVGGDWKDALPAAAAVECVHAFSLVHDDLPAMDDDDYRRGRLTTHKKFGEALGILAGDALLAFAFEEMTRLGERGVAAERVLEAVRLLAWASGPEALIAGQALDLAAEGKPATLEIVTAVHERKTGALLGTCMALGALVGGADSSVVETLGQCGVELGVAFQIHDDLLNSGSSLAKLGKRTGTDVARGKATYPGAVGEARARSDAQSLLSNVSASLAGIGARGKLLRHLVQSVAERDR